jgi:hypothetical protein
MESPSSLRWVFWNIVLAIDVVSSEVAFREHFEGLG